jgi:peroxiredoxin
MKQIIVLFALLPCLVQAQEKPFSVRGKIGRWNAPVKVYIFYRSADVDRSDSSFLRNGRFSFKGTIDQAFRGELIFDQEAVGLSRAAQDHRFTIYVEPGTIKVESPDSATRLTITGTPLNEDCERLKQLLRIGMGRKEAFLKFIRENPGSLVSFDALKEYAGISPDPFQVEPVYNELSDSLKATPAVLAYHKRLQDLKKIAIGQTAPDFTQADTAGKKVSLHDFRGQYVLLDFWASWCHPCRKENPTVVKAFHRYKDKGFTVISVSLDAPGARDKWLKAIHDDGLEGWTHLSDLSFWGNEVARLYCIQSIPQNFLLDKDGKIIAKNLRGDELLTQLDKIVK